MRFVTKKAFLFRNAIAFEDKQFMIRIFSLSAIAFLVLSACSDSSESNDKLVQEVVDAPVDAEKITDGRLVISTLEKVAEPNACILPITVTNGTDKPATISMMQFAVTGTGEDDSGNMFGQRVEAGETNTARILFPSRQCEELLEVKPGNLKCETNGMDCVENVEFESLPGLTFIEKSSD